MKKIDLACIIDDDPIFVFGAKKIMEYANFCSGFMIFRNGKEALDTLLPRIKSNENLPDIILLDINMPVMDGWQFLDEFTNTAPKKAITIYMVTSSIDPEDVKKAQKYSQISNYIVKPLTRKKLEEILNDF